jgi:tetratricopeptide (TPR) repeat protein
MREHSLRQSGRHRPRPRPIRWRRLIIFLVVSLTLAYGTLLIILASGNIISSVWFYVIGPVIALIGIMLTLYPLVFSSSPTDTISHLSQPQSSSKHPTPNSTTSESAFPIWNVPYLHSPFFIGREALLAHLYDTLHNAKAAALTQAISGLGGIGKTQLAVEYAYLYRDKYHYILWTTATNYAILSADFVALAEALDLPEKDSQDQIITVNAVIHWLEINSHWLLIFDNADNLEIIRDFLPTAGKGHVIITTLSQATGAIAQPLEVTKLEPDDGAVLLLHRARIIPLDASLTDASDENQADARAIADLLDGLPLAIDQAGAYIEEMRCSLAVYRERYHTERATLLKERGRYFSVHPASVATTFSLSFQQVQKTNPAAADLLRFFAFLSPEAILMDILIAGASALGKPLRRIARNPQQLDRALSTLYSYSLVRHDAATNTLYVHRLVQAVLKDAMSTGTQHQWAERTVLAVNRVFPSVGAETWQRCRQLIPQATVCMTLIDQWHMSFAEATRLLNQAGIYLREHAQYSEAESFLQQALAIRERVLGANHPDTAQSLNNLAALYKNQGKYEQAEPLLQQALTIHERVLGANHPDTALSLNNLAALYSDQGKYEQAEPLYQRALAICEKVLGAEHPNTANSLNNLAHLYSDQGKYEQVEPLYQRALAIREKVLGPEHPDTASSLNNLAMFYYSQGKYEQAEPLLQQALTIREKVLGPEHPDLANSLNNLATLYKAQGKHEQAEPLLQQALTIKEQARGPEDSDTATTLYALASLYQAQGKYEQAEPLYQRALAIDEKAFGPEHPEVATDLQALALLYRDQGKYEQAELLFNRAIAIDEKTLGQEHPDLARALSNLALLYWKQDKYEQAEPLLQRALAICDRVLGADHPYTALSLNNLAAFYSDQGKYEQAEPLYQRALAIREKVLGPDHPDTATSLNNLAQLYSNQGKYEQALAIREQRLGPDHPETAAILNNLAALYQHQGKYEQAESLLQRAQAIYEKRLGPDHPDTMTARENYTDLLEKRKDKKRQQS